MAEPHQSQEAGGGGGREAAAHLTLGTLCSLCCHPGRLKEYREEAGQCQWPRSRRVLACQLAPGCGLPSRADTVTGQLCLVWVGCAPGPQQGCQKGTVGDGAFPSPYGKIPLSAHPRRGHTGAVLYSSVLVWLVISNVYDKTVLLCYPVKFPGALLRSWGSWSVSALPPSTWGGVPPTPQGLRLTVICPRACLGAWVGTRHLGWRVLHRPEGRAGFLVVRMYPSDQETFSPSPWWFSVWSGGPLTFRAEGQREAGIRLYLLTFSLCLHLKKKILKFRDVRNPWCSNPRAGFPFPGQRSAFGT